SPAPAPSARAARATRREGTHLVCRRRRSSAASCHPTLCAVAAVQLRPAGRARLHAGPDRGGRVTRFVENTITFPYQRSLGPVVGAFMTALTERRILGIRHGDPVLVLPMLSHTASS